MKSIISKQLNLKKVTISIYKIYGASAAPNDDQTDVPTYSSAYDDPTEFPFNPLYLSQEAEICAQIIQQLFKKLKTSNVTIAGFFIACIQFIL